MSRKNKIIVSVVGIVIVTLALLGITYAYYLTKIQGNTNTNSISLSTANLLLKYDDGSGAVVKEDIMPGVTFTKTFSVTNEGEGKVDNYVVYLEEVTNDLKRPQDFTYTLTCESTSAASPCSGGSGEFPKLAGIIANNSIDVDVTHTYTMTLTYENLTDTDQSIDMGSTIQGYIQIYNQKDIVDIQGEVTNLNEGDYAQINSIQKISQIVDGEYKFGGVAPGTHTITIRYIDEDGNEQIRSTKTITIQKSTSAGVDGDTINVTDDSQTITININIGTGTFEVSETIKDAAKSLKDIIKTSNNVKNIADYYTSSTGENSYYFTGNASDNYMNYGGKCWRIVRVQGNGTVKLALADKDNECDKGYTLNANDSVLDATIYREDIEELGLSNFVDAFKYDDSYVKSTLSTWGSANIVQTNVDTSNKWCNDLSIESESFSFGYDDNYNWVYEESEATNDKYYDSIFSPKTRLENNNASLLCSNTGLDNTSSNLFTDYIGVLTSDEVLLTQDENNNTYLSDDVTVNYWTMSPSYFCIACFEDAYMYYVKRDGTLAMSVSAGTIAIRPSIVLNKNLKVFGTGTYLDPYIIN